MDNKWHTAANWNFNAVPGARDTAIIENAFVTVDMNHFIAKVILMDSQLSISGSLTVNNNNSSDGIIAKDSDIIIHSSLEVNGANRNGTNLDSLSSTTNFGEVIIYCGHAGILNASQILRF